MEMLTPPMPHILKKQNGQVVKIRFQIRGAPLETMFMDVVYHQYRGFIICPSQCERVVPFLVVDGFEKLWPPEKRVMESQSPVQSTSQAPPCHLTLSLQFIL